MKNIYKGTTENPFHLSVGAVLINDKNEVCCHYFKEFKLKTDLVTLENFYILMRETIEPGESLEDALSRGLLEEFGARGTTVSYVGSIKSQFNRINTPIEKTTLYFLVNLIDFDFTKRRMNDEENSSITQWQPIDFLISKMKEQSQRCERTDLDESIILERVKILNTKS